MNALLSADGIAKSFGPTRVLSGITLSVAPGEPVGLFGPNGSGKTTLVNILSGLLPPDAGTVRFDGKEITRMPLDARYRLGIARTFQIPHPYPALSVREAVRVALAVSAGKRKREGGTRGTRRDRPRISSSGRDCSTSGSCCAHGCPRDASAASSSRGDWRAGRSC